MEHSYHIQRYQPPPHRRNRNAANNIFISEQAEQQPRILNITSTAQNETPFALYPYHFNFGTGRTQEQKQRLITSIGKSSTIHHQTKERAAERK